MLTLRPVVDADVAWLDGWLTSVAASVAYGGVNGAGPGLSLIERMRVERSLRARIIVRDGDDTGLVVYRVDAPRRRSAIIEIIATPPEQARRGSGMSAASAVEDELRAAGVRWCTRRRRPCTGSRRTSGSGWGTGRGCARNGRASGRGWRGWRGSCDAPMVARMAMGQPRALKSTRSDPSDGGADRVGAGLALPCARREDARTTSQGAAILRRG